MANKNKKNTMATFTQDKELKDFCKEFFQAFSKGADYFEAAKSGNKKGKSSSVGIMEISKKVLKAQENLVSRAAELLQAKAAHEKTIRQIATRHAHEFFTRKGADIGGAIRELVKEIAEHGNTSFDYLVPNPLVQLDGLVEEIDIGRVKIIQADNFVSKWKSKYPNHHNEIVSGKKFWFTRDPKLVVELPPTIWRVQVDAAQANVEEEGAWLIDVAVSYLRLRCWGGWSGYFPMVGDVEPNPVRAPNGYEGVKIEGDQVTLAGSSARNGYNINDAVLSVIQMPEFSSQAKIILDPQPNSLAERVSQGLGWLTRGRQAEDRAERLLFFFTAIEALLSTSDKTAPVTQTIARHAAVILKSDNAERQKVAADIRKLYDYRSSVVHKGARSVYWLIANNVQSIAELLFYNVLHTVDLQIKHDTFCSELAKASYGTAWPAVQGNSAP